jgi:hypothetical protein
MGVDESFVKAHRLTGGDTIYDPTLGPLKLHKDHQGYYTAAVITQVVQDPS